MTFFGWLLDRDDLHAELGGSLCQGSQHPFAIALLVVVLFLVAVFLP